MKPVTCNIKHESQNIKIKTLLVLSPLLFLAAGCDKQQPETEGLFGTGTVTIGEQVLNVEIAQTPLARQQGLGGRKALAENNGMLFLFSNPDKVAFWMKDTLIPLDLIWIKSGRVLEITPNVRPEPNVADSSLQRYFPADPVDSVIEVNAGWTSKNNIKVGDSVAPVAREVKY
jgi:uncharacterized membrane protein (UPF0127 family)